MIKSDKISNKCKLEREIKDEQKKLKMSEKRFHDIALSSVDWIWEVDKNGRYIFTSGKLKQILGYESEEVIGKTPFDFMPKNDVSRNKKIFNDLIAQKKPIVDLENWNLTKGGKRVLLLTSGVPILDKAGNLLGYRGVDKDITKHKQMENKHLLFFKSFQTSPNSTIIARYEKKEAKILHVNQAFLDLYGYNQKEVIGKTPQILRSGKQDDKFYQKLWQDVLDSKKGFWSGEIINKRKNGDWVHVILNINTIFDEQKNPAHFAASHVNIAQLKKVEKQKQEQIEALGKLNKTMVGRELKMIELKKEIVKLKNKSVGKNVK